MRRIAYLFFLLALLPALASASDWLYWRGANQNGYSDEKNLPGEWSPKNKGGKNLVWQQPFGCRSAPVVSKGKVFIVGGVNEGKVDEQERVLCCDASTGKLLWEHRFNVFLCDIVSARVGWSNPAADAETGNIYVHGVQGLFYCFNEDGKILWEKSFTEEFGRVTGYGGRVTSPIIVDDLVIIHFLNASWGDQGRGSHRFFAFDKKTGQLRWWSQAGGQPLDTIYSIPVVLTVKGEKILVCGGADGGVHALQVNTGKPVWSMRLSTRGLNASPVVDQKKGWVYITVGEENIPEVVGKEQANKQGLVLCLDCNEVTPGADGKVGKPKVVWMKVGIDSGYASPTLHDGRIYVANNAAKLFCLDANNGEEYWSIKYGRVAKGSPVLADGKIYIGEVGATWHILKPEDRKCTVLSSVKVTAPGIPVLEVNGTPAISNGKVYLSDVDNLYCISLQKADADKPTEVKALSSTYTVNQDANIAQLLVVPNEVSIHPGESVEFKVRAYDAKGNFISETKAEWSLPEAVAPVPPNAPPGTQPAKIPALKGTVENGKLVVDKAMPAQSGVVQATVTVGGKPVVNKARVRVAPLLPYNQDFQGIEPGRIPTGWINLAGKFQTIQMADGNRVLKKTGTNPNTLVARASAYIGLPDLANYTITSDVRAIARVDKSPTGEFVNLPDMGLINARYTFALDGNKQKLFLRSWEARRRIDQTLDFPWKADVWYTMKLEIRTEGNKAICRGKVWVKGEAEPQKWTIELTDTCPNTSGAPALYAFGTGIPDDPKSGPGSEVLFDNVVVTPNSK